jgi:hypothetical protein
MIKMKCWIFSKPAGITAGTAEEGVGLAVVVGVGAGSEEEGEVTLLEVQASKVRLPINASEIKNILPLFIAVLHQ